MEDMLLIGLGHKARQGKDETAKIIKQLSLKEVKIIHFADSLYSEVANKEREFPLIKKIRLGGIEVFQLLSDTIPGKIKRPIYEGFMRLEVPFLDEYFKARNITEYWGMNDKDSEMLQFWGTNYRRTFHTENYWVIKAKQKIDNLKKTGFEGIIILPDTRFKNEVGFVYGENGLYVDVICLLPDGSQYISPDRDPKHQSEVELDGQQCDYTVIAQKGDIPGLITSVKNFMKHYQLELKEDYYDNNENTGL
jgi:hypothetical protein